MSDSYKIVLFYEGDHPTEKVRSGLTLEEAQAHCKDSNTTSRTCTTAAGRARTRKHGPWFEGFTKE
jgi:hypothetical protein